MLGGTEEYSVSQQGVIDLSSRQIHDFLRKGNRKKFEIVARPDDHRRRRPGSQVPDPTIVVESGQSQVHPAGGSDTLDDLRDHHHH